MVSQHILIKASSLYVIQEQVLFPHFLVIFLLYFSPPFFCPPHYFPSYHKTAAGDVIGSASAENSLFCSVEGFDLFDWLVWARLAGSGLRNWTLGRDEQMNREQLFCSHCRGRKT